MVAFQLPLTLQRPTVRLFSDTKLHIDVSVSVNGCLPLYISPVME